ERAAPCHPRDEGQAEAGAAGGRGPVDLGHRTPREPTEEGRVQCRIAADDGGAPEILAAQRRGVGPHAPGRVAVPGGGPGGGGRGAHGRASLFLRPMILHRRTKVKPPRRRAYSIRITIFPKCCWAAMCANAAGASAKGNTRSTTGRTWRWAKARFMSSNTS